MAPAALQQILSALKPLQTTTTSTQGPLVSSKRPFRPAASSKLSRGDLPPAVKRVLKDVSTFPETTTKDVPACIANNPLWACLSPLAKKVYSICDMEHVAAIMVVLRSCGSNIVVKGMPAFRVEESELQIQSELKAAGLFSGNPLMATVQAVCYDAQGNFCSIMPYVGCSLESIIGHPDWFSKISSQDRVEFTRSFIMHNLMTYETMQNMGTGYLFRDVKPGNCCVDLTTGVAAVIDLELMIRTTKEDFFAAESMGYYPPEFVAGVDKGDYGVYINNEARKAATNTTMDVFLTSFVGLQVAVGLHNSRWQLQASQHNVDTTPGMRALLGQHAAAAVAGYEALIAHVKCPVAQDFFRQTICADPALRPTPAQALGHQWLASSRAAAQQALAALTPTYHQQNQQLVEIISKVPGIILPQPTQQQPQQQQMRQAPAAVHCMAPAQLPTSVTDIILDIPELVTVEGHEVPEIVVSNPMWNSLSPLAKEIYLISDTDRSTTLLVVLCASGIKLVVKACTADCVEDNMQQIAAELDAARSFAWHPLMATPVAACYDRWGNFCSVMLYAGCSMRSIFSHPDWFEVVTAQDRLELVRQMILQHMTVFDIMQHTGVGHYYRDVKSGNCCLNPSTGLVSVIDYGLKVRANMEDYHESFTPGYHTPEMVDPGPNGKFETFCSRQEQMDATTNTYDTFLTSYVGLEAAVGLNGLPWKLHPQDYNIDNIADFVAMLRAHAAAAAVGYEELIARVDCPVAGDFFRQTMCADPAQRLTPAQALNHEWLAGSTAAVQQAVAAATPEYLRQNRQLQEMFNGVPGVILLRQQESMQVTSPARPMAPAARISASIKDIIRDCCQLESIQDCEVPQVIAGNPLWSRLSPLTKELYILCDTEQVTALLVVLCDSGIELVVKACPAERAEDNPQVVAELDAARSFTWHPLIGTLVAACYDDGGNFCSILPYVGCSLGSIIHHPGWLTAVSAQDRLELMRQVILQSMMVFDIMQHTGVGHYYRDVKPDNLCVNPTTGLASVIDYGLKVRASMEDYEDGETPGYHTPEMVNPGPNGRFDTYRSSEKTMHATNNTSDVFLISYVGLEAAVGLEGLPWKLQARHHDINTGLGLVGLLKEHAAAAAAGYEDLIARVLCPTAQDFFRQTMCADPAERLTPAQALDHEWLAGSRVAVQQAVEAATPAYQQVNQQLVELFSGVPGVILPQQQQQQHTLSAAPSVVSSVTVEVHHSAGAESTPQHSSSSSDGEAAADQLPAASVQKTPSLLQRGKSMITQLSKYSKQNDEGFGAGQKDSTAAPDGMITVVEVQEWVDEECYAVSVPGLCGMIWSRGSKISS